MIRMGNYGAHFGGFAPEFIRTYLFPLFSSTPAKQPREPVPCTNRKA